MSRRYRLVGWLIAVAFCYGRFVAGEAAFAQVPAPSRSIGPVVWPQVTVDTLHHQWNRTRYNDAPLFRPTVLLVTSWGEVWTTDVGDRAVYRWSIGEFLGYREIALTIDSHGFMSAVGFRNDTTMVMAANYTGPAPGPLDNRAVLWRFVGTGPRADSLLAMPGTRMTVFRQDGYAMRYLSPFTPHAYAVFGLPGRVLVGYGGHDEIAVYDYNMTNVAAVDLDLPLLSVTRQDKSTSSGGATQPIHSVMKGRYICPTTE